MAIILPQGRPAIDILQDSFGAPPKPWEHLGRAPRRGLIEAAIQCVGRLEQVGDPLRAYLGTATLVAPDLVMTDRSLAEQITGKKWAGPAQGVVIDFAQEGLPRQGRRAQAIEVVLIHPHWPVALIRIEPVEGVVPLRLAAQEVDPEGGEVALIGYPAKDFRQDPKVSEAIFRSTYQTKRLLPGRLIGGGSFKSYGRDLEVLLHDCTTAGGCGGAPLIDLETGSVVGIHFAGRYLEANYALPSAELVRDPHLIDAGVQVDGSPASPAPEWMDAWAKVEITNQAGTPLTDGGVPVDLTLLLPGAPIPTARPALTVMGGELPQDSEWSPLLASHAARVGLALRAVARLHPRSRPELAAVAFAVGDNQVMTVRAFLVPFTSGKGEEVTLEQPMELDFSLGLGQATGAATVPVEAVRFLHPHFDVALLQVEALPPGVARLQLVGIAPEDLAGRLVLTLEFEGAAEASSVRVQPGLAHQIGREGSTDIAALVHDCASSLAGLGAPVIDLGSGRVLGVQTRSASGEVLGSAAPSWELARDPRLWEQAIRFYPDPRPPWMDKWGAPHVEQSAATATAAPSASRWTVDVLPPIDFSAPEPQALESLLASMISTPQLATYHAEGAGLPPGSFDSLNAPSMNVLWRNLIKAASGRGLLRKLIEQLANTEQFVGYAPKLRQYL